MRPSVKLNLLPRPGITRDNHRPDSSARTKLAFHFRPLRLGGAHHVLQHAIDDVLLKDSQVAISSEVLLQGLQFQAVLVRHIADPEYTEVRQASLGADRSKLRNVDHDL